MLDDGFDDEPLNQFNVDAGARVLALLASTTFTTQLAH